MHFNIFEGKVPHAIILESSDLNKAFCEACRIVSEIFCTSEGKKPCGECLSCIKLEKSIHPDLKIVSPPDSSKTIKVEQVRFVRQDAFIVPNESDYKAYIFSPAESLTVQAQNAFIKILEEPPKNIVFILVCKSTELLLETVLSRCEIFRIKAEPNGNTDDEMIEKSEEILELSIKGKKAEILKVLAGVPSDREVLKNLICKIMNGFMQKIRCCEIPALQGVEKIERLKNLLEFLEKNVNLNLVISCLCAEL